MREVFIKNKKANHKVNVDGKLIQFINGKATVDNDTAEKITGPEYTVKDPQAEKPKAPAKAAKRTTKKKTIKKR